MIKNVFFLKNSQFLKSLRPLAGPWWSGSSNSHGSTSSVDSGCLGVELGRESVTDGSGDLELGLEKSQTRFTKLIIFQKKHVFNHSLTLLRRHYL